MRKYAIDIKKEVILRRKNGLSFREISQMLDIPKTTIAGWLIDDPIDSHRREKIRKKGLIALQEGRIKTQNKQKKINLELGKELMEKGIAEVGVLTKRELFIAGVALYWAEGFKNKHEHRLGFCNSDINMIKFYLVWLKNILSVDQKQVVARVTINISYRDKIEEIQEYWSKATGIPLSNFTKPFYQNTKWKKEYNNSNYYGVMRIHVNKSMDKLLQMRGWIKGLHYNLPG